jgi:hypothetical protein
MTGVSEPRTGLVEEESLLSLSLSLVVRRR